MGLVNLMSHIETTLGGSPPSPGLKEDLARRVEPNQTVVLVLFDGLGHRQIDPVHAPAMAEADIGPLHSPFPSTTTVSLATLATGLPPAGHGVIGHLMWIPRLRQVVNTLKWVDTTGAQVTYDTTRLLPAPNLWERLAAGGVEPITVQPGDFLGTPLTTALYRGCRFEPVFTGDETVEATVGLASRPGRLIFTYLPQVDFAAHVHGQGSPEYRRAVLDMDNLWSALATRLPPHVTLVGTADHGLLDYTDEGKIAMRGDFDRLTAFGDPRAVYLKGDSDLIGEFARRSGGALIGREILESWWGVGTAWATLHPHLDGRRPDALVLAPSGRVLLPRGFDRRLIGYHGGLDPAEIEIPLLVR